MDWYETELFPEEMPVFRYLQAMPVEDAALHPVLGAEGINAVDTVKLLRKHQFFKNFGEGLDQIYESTELEKSTVRFFLEVMQEPAPQSLHFLKVTKVTPDTFECLLSTPVSLSIKFP